MRAGDRRKRAGKGLDWFRWGPASLQWKALLDRASPMARHLRQMGPWGDWNVA